MKKILTVVLFLTMLMMTFTSCEMLDEIISNINLPTASSENSGSTNDSENSKPDSSTASSVTTDGSTDNGENTEPVKFHFVDVGQGDSIYIQAGDKNILIDTGTSSAKDELQAYLDSYGVKEIEYFIVTHFDSDHFGGGVHILDTYDVKNVIIPDQVKTTKTYEKFIAKLEEQVEDKGLNVLNANEMVGDVLNVAGLELKILAPLKNNYDDSNDYSIVTMATYLGKRVLLTGDAEKEAESDLVSTYSAKDLDCDVLKLGHHGSRTSNSQELLDKSTPIYAVACCGVDNSYGHPHSEVLERLSNIDGLVLYRTDTQGSIVFTVSTDGIEITTEK